MYSGFNYKVSNANKFTQYVSEGEKLFEIHKRIIKDEINNYLVNGILDGTKIQNDWFPAIKADIFISHSHKDETIAMGLAGWLYEKFNITAFIDSCVWGNSVKLLRDIDEAHSRMDSNPDMFDYDKRNYSTSHVHMMLQTALYKMIDNVEAVFVLNTDNSFETIEKVKNTIKNKTSSPWIFSEIIATTLIRKKSLSEYRTQPTLEHRNFAENNKSLNIEYDIDLTQLIKIDSNILDEWYRKYEGSSRSISNLNYNLNNEIAMDFLYKLIEHENANKK